MKTYRIYQVDSFTKDRFAGNPAGVVTNADGLSDTQMQSIARELGNPETAFILGPTSADHDVWIRFFTPTIEVPSCGHATIAAHYARALEDNLPSCTVIQKIGIGILPVDIERDGDDYRVTMTQGAIQFEDPLADPIRDKILLALGLVVDDLYETFPVQIVSTGHSKVLVGISRQSKLHALQPDLGQLRQLSATIGCNGYFVFTLDSASDEILAHGRMFAPAIGIPEDPVTGNANGPLGAYLTHHKVLSPTNNTVSFRAKQGEALGRPGVVAVTVELENGQPTKVKVSGQATVVFQTEIRQ